MILSFSYPRGDRRKRSRFAMMIAIMRTKPRKRANRKSGREKRDPENASRPLGAAFRRPPFFDGVAWIYTQYMVTRRLCECAWAFSFFVYPSLAYAASLSSHTCRSHACLFRAYPRRRLRAAAAAATTATRTTLIDPVGQRG